MRRVVAAASRATARADRHCDAQHRPGARCLWRRRRPYRPIFVHRYRHGGDCRCRHGRLAAGNPDRLSAGGRPGRVLCRHSTAGRGFGGANARCGRAGRAGAEKGGDGRRLHVGSGVEFHRQLLAAKRRLYRRHVETVRGAQGRGSWRQWHSRAPGTAIPADRRRHGAAAEAAADHRPRHRRRFHLCARGFARRRCAGARPSRARAHDSGQRGPATEPRLQHVLGHQSLDLSRYRSRQGADTGGAAQQCLPGAAGLARRLLCQQRQSVRPHLAGPGAGGGAGSAAASTTFIASMCATRTGR